MTIQNFDSQDAGDVWRAGVASSYLNADGVVDFSDLGAVSLFFNRRCRG
jgi:hypothetical protein